MSNSKGHYPVESRRRSSGGWSCVAGLKLSSLRLLHKLIVLSLFFTVLHAKVLRLRSFRWAVSQFMVVHLSQHNTEDIRHVQLKLGLYPV